MFKKLLHLVFIVFIPVFPVVAQDIDFSRLQVKPVPDAEHICTLDPTHINAHLHIAPSASMRKEMQRQASTMFEVDYGITGQNSCGHQTWPEEAFEAFEYAMELWAAHLRSVVPIKIQAIWTELDGTTLGSAGPTRVARLPNVGVPDTWYSIAQLTAMSGQAVRDQINLDPDNPDAGTLQHDIRMNINCSFDDWYFGTDAKTPEGGIDFVTVVLHEIGHGIGFFGSMAVPEDSEQGHWGLGSPPVPLIFDRYTVDGNLNNLLNQSVYPNPSNQLFSALTGQRDGVFFNGEDALLTLEKETITQARLFSPPEWSAGSSYSHVDQETFSKTVNALMRPRIDRALAVHTPGPLFCGVLSDIGWPLGPGCLSFLAADAIIALDQTEINFGVINEDENISKNLRITSNPESVENLSGTLELESDDFFIFGANSFELEPGQSVDIIISYNPSDNDIHKGSIQLFHNGKNIQPPIIIPLVGEALEQNQTVQLDQSYPNPMVPTQPVPKIPYAISKSASVSLDLYSINGQHIQSLVRSTQQPGRYEAVVDITELASGIYIYKIIVDNSSKSGKMMIVK